MRGLVKHSRLLLYDFLSSNNVQNRLNVVWSRIVV